jgi:hypothetical protein
MGDIFLKVLLNSIFNDNVFFTEDEGAVVDLTRYNSKSLLLVSKLIEADLLARKEITK